MFQNSPARGPAAPPAERERLHMAEEQNHSLPADGQDTMMVYINPQLIQSLAYVSA